MKKIFILLFLSGIVYCSEKKIVHDEIAYSGKIVFFGDSLTAGKGVAPEEAYPSRIQELLQKDHFNYQVINAGVSGDTTGTALARLDWVLSGGFDVFIIELGANDGMRGIPVSVMKKNLIQIIRIVKEKNPSGIVLLMEMKAFPNMGIRFQKEFDRTYAEVSKKEKIGLLPFFLKGVAGKQELNQSDGIHPIAEGHKMMAAIVYKSLLQYLPVKP